LFRAAEKAGEIFIPEQHAYHCDTMLEALGARFEKVSGLPAKYAVRTFLKNDNRCCI
jgi:hypothetical protein